MIGRKLQPSTKKCPQDCAPQNAPPSLRRARYFADTARKRCCGGVGDRACGRIGLDRQSARAARGTRRALRDNHMNTAPEINRTEETERPLDLGEPSQMRSPAVASPQARRGSSWIWLPLLAVALIILGMAVVGAMSRNDDSGVRGPADEAAPHAPRNATVPPARP